MDIYVNDESGSNEIGKSSFPAFPGEEPTKTEAIRWLDKWSDDLDAMGYGAIRRDEVPAHLTKLAPREFIPNTEPATASITAENARIQHQIAKVPIVISILRVVVAST